MFTNSKTLAYLHLPIKNQIVKCREAAIYCLMIVNCVKVFDSGNNLRVHDSTLPWLDGNKLCGIGCKIF